MIHRLPRGTGSLTMSCCTGQTILSAGSRCFGVPAFCPDRCHPAQSSLLKKLQSSGHVHCFRRATAVVVHSRRRGRTRFCPKALVAVEWNPAVFIGLALVGGGLVLYQLRSLRPEISRDFDIVASSVCIFSGGILITQVFHMTLIGRINM
jgi:Ycf66 protein N-terminus